MPGVQDAAQCIKVNRFGEVMINPRVPRALPIRFLSIARKRY